MDLFNNPMVDAAKRAMSAEQMNEYKEFGRYMYSDNNIRTIETSRKIEAPTNEALLGYAVTALKSGGDPQDLSDEELQVLIKTYGKNWYEQFGLTEEEVREPIIQTTGPTEGIEEIRKQAKKLNYSRQLRRALERKHKKMIDKVKGMKK